MSFDEIKDLLAKYDIAYTICHRHFFINECEDDLYAEELKGLLDDSRIHIITCEECKGC